MEHRYSYMEYVKIIQHILNQSTNIDQIGNIFQEAPNIFTNLLGRVSKLTIYGGKILC